jgi:hypothetical protein
MRRSDCTASLKGMVKQWRHKSDGGSTLKQNTVIRVSRLFVLCISLVFGGKYMEFRTIFSLQYSISINTFEVDPPSDWLQNAVVKPKNNNRWYQFYAPTNYRATLMGTGVQKTLETFHYQLSYRAFIPSALTLSWTFFLSVVKNY